jgi:hypothetical protein
MPGWREVIGFAVLALALSAHAGTFKKDAADVGDAGTEGVESAVDVGAAGDKAGMGEETPAPARSESQPLVQHTYEIAASAPQVEGAVVQSRELADGVIDLRKPMFGAINCPPKDADYDKYYVVCAQVSGDRVEAVSVFPDTGAVLLPNHSFRVIILHPRDRRIVVATTAAYGVYAPAVRALNEGLGPREKIHWTVTEKTLPPFRPPKASIHIGVAMPRSDAELDGTDVDFVVQDVYAGALRIGIAALGFDARNQEYARVPDAAGTGYEVKALQAAQADFELVVGYTPYLDTGGRGQLGCSRRPFCFAPYIGVGVVAPKPQANGFDALTSVHLGIDWEITSAFSISASLVARRVDRLAPGLQVGGPVGGEADLTHKEMGYGAAVLLNVSPDFLKIAMTGGASLLR